MVLDKRVNSEVGVAREGVNPQLPRMWGLAREEQEHQIPNMVWVLEEHKTAVCKVCARFDALLFLPYKPTLMSHVLCTFNISRSQSKRGHITPSDWRAVVSISGGMALIRATSFGFYSPVSFRPVLTTILTIRELLCLILSTALQRVYKGFTKGGNRQPHMLG